MGLRDKQSKNELIRARGTEPETGAFAGVKRRARYLRRTEMPEIKIRDPERYLNSHARQMVGLRRAASKRAR